MDDTDILADAQFWDRYWENRTLPDRVNPNFSFDRSLAAFLSKFLEHDPAKSAFEIGCAPGKWLLFLNETFGYEIEGLDYSNVGIAKTYENWEAAGRGGKLFEGDFFEFQSAKEYDLVYSFGFIEHFAQPEEVIVKHVKLVKPGGLLVLGVPNFQGWNRVLQSAADKTILEKHNLDIMNREFFLRVGRDLGLRTIAVEYAGGFEPELIIFNGRPNPAIRLVRKVSVLIRNNIRFFDRVNSHRFSSYILGVYENPGEET